MANQLRKWIQNDVITPLGAKAGISGTLNASKVKETILALPNTTDLQNFIKDLIEGNITELIIPPYITKINNYTFYQGTLTSVTIPDNVTEIGDSCFKECGKLESVTFGKGLNTINSGAFYNCKLLNNVVLPSEIKTINAESFYYCSILDNITTGKELNIGRSCFNYTNIKKWYYNGKLNDYFSLLTFANSTAHPFYYQKSGSLYVLNDNNEYYEVKNLVIPNDVTIINFYLFYGCKSLTSVTIPDNVTEIKSGAFEECRAISEMTIPSNVLTIGSTALKICGLSGKATFIFKHIEPPSITSTTFYNSYLNRIYVPKGYSAVYKAATNWSNFAAYIFEPNNITFNVDSSLLNNENVLYSIDGAEEQQFTQTSFTGENLATLRVTSKTAGVVVKVGTTNGGSEIGTVANASTTFTFESDTTIYITKQ